jgi:hypothetical protein
MATAGVLLSDIIHQTGHHGIRIALSWRLKPWLPGEARRPSYMSSRFGITRLHNQLYRSAVEGGY